jgi:hypothetical protein
VLPDLSDVRIISLTLQDDGPTVLIRLVLATFPDRPPVRWQRHAYNAAILELRLFGASGLRLEGWSTDNVATVSLVRNVASVHLEMVGPGVLFLAHGIAADVSRIEGYHRASAAGASGTGEGCGSRKLGQRGDGGRKSVGGISQEGRGSGPGGPREEQD